MVKLNKTISTPVGILIILILAFLVGGILVWQFQLLLEEEIKIPEIKPLLVEEAIPEETDDYEKIAGDFCKEKNFIFEEECPAIQAAAGECPSDGKIRKEFIYKVLYFSPLNFDKDNAKELFVMCGQMYNIDVYLSVLKKVNEKYSLIWEKNTPNEFGFRTTYKSEIIDVDRDGIDEIVFRGGNWGGTCTGSTDSIILYSPKRDDFFRLDINRGSKGIGRINNMFCLEEKLINPDWCDGEYERICFSNNLKRPEYQVFKKYLEKELEEYLREEQEYLKKE